MSTRRVFCAEHSRERGRPRPPQRLSVFASLRFLSSRADEWQRLLGTESPSRNPRFRCCGPFPDHTCIRSRTTGRFANPKLEAAAIRRLKAARSLRAYFLFSGPGPMPPSNLIGPTSDSNSHLPPHAPQNWSRTLLSSPFFILKLIIVFSKSIFFGSITIDR